MKKTETPINSLADRRKGVLAALGCYLFWGFCPLFWALLEQANAWEIIGHRMLWSFVFVALTCKFVLKCNFGALLKDKRALAYLVPAGIIITANWSIYIAAVLAHHVVEASLGYYINPLITITFGVIFFKERLSPLQIAALTLSAAGVLYFTLDYGQFPLIAIALAVLFGAYGAIKKKGGYPAIQSIAVEGAVTLPIALVFIVVITATGQSAFLMGPAATSIAETPLLLLAGPVTAIPLILFAAAANKAPLTIIGFIQYVSPTISLLVGVFALGEPFTTAHAVCFTCIWAGIALVTIDTLRKHVSPMS